MELVVTICLILSAAFFALPIVIGIFSWLIKGIFKEKRSGRVFNRVLAFSGFLLISIWCLRYAVGYYGVMSADAPSLTWYEEIFNSVVHTLQTFSMDEDYTEYIITGKEMVVALFPSADWLVTLYGIYAALLNMIAPIAGGAIIFDILASIFPKIKLRLLSAAFFREKYYFSDLNEASLALATDIRRNAGNPLREPVIIFTDVYGDSGNEISSELINRAKAIGALCVKDDLAHVYKPRIGKLRFILIDENEINNISALTDLASAQNQRYLRQGSNLLREDGNKTYHRDDVEIYLFSSNDTYIEVEQQFRRTLITDYKFNKEELPMIFPVNRYRNLITNLLVELPLYEPLVRRNDGEIKIERTEHSLSVTILGTGSIGMEMLLSCYWFSQMLGTVSTINIVSDEPEQSFIDKLDTLNPEILKTVRFIGEGRTIPESDEILSYDRHGNQNDPYAIFRYFECNVNSSKFINLVSNSKAKDGIANSDYVFVALGSDEDNISAGDMIHKYIGEAHINGRMKNTVITYVVYDSDLANTLNQKSLYSSVGNAKPDIYFRAVGDLEAIYSYANIFMKAHESDAVNIRNSYNAVMLGEKIEKKRYKRGNSFDDDYKYWADVARGMHRGYKAFSLGMCRRSVFDNELSEDSIRREGYDFYKTQAELMTEYEKFARMKSVEAKYMPLLNELAWLEHRRWNAFTRIMGFRHTENYERFINLLAQQSPSENPYSDENTYKHMRLRLHPCLIECNKDGILGASFDYDVERKKIEVKAMDVGEGFEMPEGCDLLDELSFKMRINNHNNYDFKQYDYIFGDF